MFLGNESQAEVITDLLSNTVQQSSKSWLFVHRRFFPSKDKNSCTLYIPAELACCGNYFSGPTAAHTHSTGKH